jgi:TolB protein
MRFWCFGLSAVSAAAALVAPAAAQAQAREPQLVVAVPPMPTPKNVDTEGGQTGVLGIQIAQLIASDLRSSGAIVAIDPDKLRRYTPTEAAAPIYPNWANSGAGALVQGYVQARDDGRITVACYLYDLKTRREMTRAGFAVGAEDWRRAAHRCADAFHKAITGLPGHFDSRITYVAETGSRTAPVKRLAIVNWDGTHHNFLTQGEGTVITPRLSPDGQRIVYVSFTGGMPHVRIMDLDGENDRALLAGPPAMSFAPVFSPDGRRIAFSMANEGNTDIYIVGAGGGFPQRLTTAPGIDTAPTFSPDGRSIAFESDRGGSQQIYVMNTDGSGQRRISFTGGGHGSPAWSPKGDLIAFSRWNGRTLSIGVIAPDGSGERMVTNGWQDERPSWAPDGEVLVFDRTQQGSGIPWPYTVRLDGAEPKRLAIPQPGSDPDWSGVLQ